MRNADEGDDRVVLVDPRGREPGRLNTPDGVDLAPPHSLLMEHAATMGKLERMPPAAASAGSGTPWK